MKITRDTIKMLCAATLLLGAVSLPLALVGCETNAVDEVEGPVDEEALKKQFAEEAEAEITADNAEESLTELEKEIESDNEDN